MANIPAPTACVPTGLDQTTLSTAALSTMTLANDGFVYLKVKTGATPTTVTITVQSKLQDGTPGGISATNPSTVIAANKDYSFGPFDKGIYNDSNNEVNFAFSAVTSVLVQAYRFVPKP